MTELHPATPIGDPLVHEAINILRQAIEALEHGQGYNGDGIGFADYCPNGLPDLLRCLMEPVVRASVSGKLDQHRDAVGYAALYMAWVRAGMPESKFAPLMRKCAFDFYQGLKESA